MVKFKDFSRPLSVFQVLFKANLIFKDFSRQSYIFKYSKPVRTMSLRIVLRSAGVFIERKYYLVLASVIQQLFHGVHLPHSEMGNKYEISNNLTF